MMLLPLLLQNSGGSAGPPIQDILASISGGAFPSQPGSGSSSGGGGLGSLLGLLTSGSPLGSILLSGSGGIGLGNLIGPLLGEQGGLGSSLGGLGGAGLGLLAGLPFGPIGAILGPLVGGFGGDLLGGLFGGGIPNTAKTGAIESNLAASGNPSEQLLADFINNQVLGQGKVLSSPGGANTGKMAQIIEWLTGQSFPGQTKGGANIGDIGFSNPGEIPVPRDLSRLNQLFGASPELSASEILPFLPQIEAMVGGNGAGGFKDLGGQVLALINSVSGQQKANQAGGSTNPTGTGGNALAAAFGAGGGNPNMSKLKAQLARLMGSGEGAGAGNLVGAT